ncbi:MAG: 3-keto-5-aminohexanoate cleavage protein [Deltaproteobacteria bacterium]|nr:3-keto-5-aminohexanoate cleavage protein [Deltaproteobacteria bacterium]
MEKKIIITAAVTGSRPMRSMNPAVPYSPKEIIEAAVDSHKAGAAVVHVHVRDPETGVPSSNIEYFKEVLEGIRERCDMIVNLTTSGLNITGPGAIEERLKPIYLKPDMCSYDHGSMNFFDRAFVNSPEWAERCAEAMKAVGVKPEIEVFDVGHVHQAKDLISRGLIDDPPYFQLCMGVRWGVGGDPEDLLFMKSKLPDKALWSVLGVQRAQLPMIAMSMLMGGHARVGFEDNIHIRKGVLAKSNAEAVEFAANLAEKLGRTVATASEARQILHIAPRG